MYCNGHCVNEEAALGVLVNAGDAGVGRWSFALVQILIARIDKLIADAVEAWVQQGPLTQARLQAQKASITHKVVRIPIFELVPRRRNVNTRCGGIKFVVEVASISHRNRAQLSFGMAADCSGPAQVVNGVR